MDEMSLDDEPKNANWQHPAHPPALEPVYPPEEPEEE